MYLLMSTQISASKITSADLNSSNRVETHLTPSPHKGTHVPKGDLQVSLLHPQDAEHTLVVAELGRLGLKIIVGCVILTCVVSNMIWHMILILSFQCSREV